MTAVWLARIALFVVAGCGGAWSKTAGGHDLRWLAEHDDHGPVDGPGTALLVVLWNSHGAALEPPDDKVTTFANAIGTMCTATETAKISTVGSYMYETVTGVQP
jgi:hypothetical protein